MNFILTLLVAAKGLFIVGGALGGASNVAIAAPALLPGDSVLAMTCSLTNVYPPELRKLALTGTQILLYLFVETWDTERNRPITRVVAENSLRFDAIGDRFVIVRKPGADSLAFTTADSALAASSRFDRIAILQRPAVSSERSYHFVITGVLGSARIDALENKSLDLMYFWKYRRPSVRTEAYRGADLFAHSRGSAQP